MALNKPHAKRVLDVCLFGVCVTCVGPSFLICFVSASKLFSQMAALRFTNRLSGFDSASSHTVANWF
jgi:hypothetical protein